MRDIPIIPRSILFGNPSQFGPQISPDGERIAWLAPLNGVVNIWVADTNRRDRKAITKDCERGVYLYYWTRNCDSLIYLQDWQGNENRHLYLVNIDSGQIDDLTPFEGVRVQQIFMDYHFPQEIIFSMNRRDKRAFDIYRLNIGSRTLTLEEENPGSYSSWLIDRNFQIRGAIKARGDGGKEVLIREKGCGQLETILTCGPEDSLQVYGFTQSGNSFYIVDNISSNTTQLYELDVTNRRRTAVCGDPGVDISHVMLNPSTYEVQAVGFVRERLHWNALDPVLKNDFDFLAQFHEGSFVVVSRDIADSKWIVLYYSDRKPGTYFTYNRQDSPVPLFSSFPQLSQFQLAEMNALTIKSRDGLDLVCYLTLPSGANPQSLPLVVNVHGGPWTRNSWAFDPEAQWLANRGYASLQVNFRGSSGFGKDFLNAGNREWGNKMHLDILDAVDWTIQEGIADPKRIGIYGRSFGGYAVLIGVTFTPQRFACGVSAMGPSNLITLLKSTPPHWSVEKARLRYRIGNEETEQKFLESRSPLFFVDNIRSPLLIAHGANDPRVKQAESDLIVDELRKKNKIVEYLVFSDEGHEFLRPNNRSKFYTTVERFLSEHLGGRFEPSQLDDLPPAS